MVLDGYSSVSCHSLLSAAWTSLIDSLISEAVSDLPVVFCNGICVDNLENSLLILKVGYVIMGLNPSTTVHTACMQVLVLDV